MIPVTPQTEPSCFDVKVRQPGSNFLVSCPLPRKKDWTGHDFWREVSDEIYLSYQGICAYTGEWFSEMPKRVSIDHYRPKSKYPSLAYEWNNYRLTTQKTNNYKADDECIADPFTILHGWFILLFPSCLIKPGNGISKTEHEMICHTIDVLKLNDDDDFVESRRNIIQTYIEGKTEFSDIRRRYPFVAYELERQNLLDINKLKSIFKALI